MSSSGSKNSLIGTLYAVSAFLAWGVLPLYWKQLQEVPALQIMLGRIVWSLLFLLVVITLRKRWPEFRGLFRERKLLLGLCSSSLLIAANWLTYIWAVNAEYIVESSLGYYMNPLITVLLGILVLKERPRCWQILAMLLALVGVLNSIIRLGSFPWIAITLALTFALYGLIRKLLAVESLLGLAVETALLTPIALLILGKDAWNGELAFGGDWPRDLLLIGSGVVTALPLLCFASGTRRLPLSSVGFLQYLAPSCQLLIGIQVYHEPFPREQQITFGFIWIALLMYSVDAFRFQRQLASGNAAVGQQENPA